MSIDPLPLDDPALVLARAAVEDASGADVAYCKFLTPNDTGETASHQAGFHISKGAWRIVLDVEGVKGQNADREWDVCWNGTLLTRSRAIYYGQGTRNEYRLTRLGPGFPYRGSRHTGDLLVITRRTASDRLNAWVLAGAEAVDEFLGAFALSPENTNQLIEVGLRSQRSGEWPDMGPEERLIREFVEELEPRTFPSTQDLAAHARRLDSILHPESRPQNEPDRVLKRWAALEYRMFRAVEERAYGDMVSAGFDTVEDFVAVANTVLNRRKSRAGNSLEHHLAAIFDDCQVEYTAQPRTEGNRRPDFVFPSEGRYHDAGWPESNLVFLAAKTTCKDRWRQILNEADRIAHKHLFTLQQGISGAQLDEMSAAGVTLVVPEENKRTFPPDHREWILSLEEFIELVRELTSR